MLRATLPTAEIDDDAEERPLSHHRNKVGLIYVVQAPPVAAVKIGYTLNENTMKGRIESLQCGNPHRIEALGTVYGSLNDEAKVHQALASERMAGEWFQWAARSVIFVGRMLVGYCARAALEAPAALPNWDDYQISEYGADNSIGGLRLSEARNENRGPAYQEDLSRGRLTRVYNMGDIMRWYATSNVFPRIDPHPWVLSARDGSGQKVADLPTIDDLQAVPRP